MAEVAFELVSFKKGAYILTEGLEELDRFYIIKQGSVERMAAKFLLNQKSTHKNETLFVGDFFGVISCMGRRPRIETVMALEDTNLIVIRRDNFGVLIQNNTAIAMKIIRYFSRQLRYYDLILAALISKTAIKEHSKENLENLFTLGEYYVNRTRNYPYAGYAFTKYIMNNPKGKNVGSAKERLAKIDPSIVKINPQREEHHYVYEDNQMIFLESEPGNELYVIQEGKVKISKVYNDKEVLLDVLKPGDIFGEMAIIENQPRNANAAASGRLKLMAITKANFEFVVKTYPDIASRIIEVLSDRIWLIYRQIANMFITDPEIKIYDALYTQLLKNRVPIARNISYNFDLGPDDLLKFIGLTGQNSKQIIYDILTNNKNLSINPEGKFTCNNLTFIEQKLNVIKRNLQIQHNMESSEYSSLLNSTK